MIDIYAACVETFLQLLCQRYRPRNQHMPNFRREIKRDRIKWNKTSKKRWLAEILFFLLNICCAFDLNFSNSKKSIELHSLNQRTFSLSFFEWFTKSRRLKDSLKQHLRVDWKIWENHLIYCYIELTFNTMRQKLCTSISIDIFPLIRLVY